MELLRPALRAFSTTLWHEARPANCRPAALLWLVGEQWKQLSTWQHEVRGASTDRWADLITDSFWSDFPQTCRQLVRINLIYAQYFSCVHVLWLIHEYWSDQSQTVNHVLAWSCSLCSERTERGDEVTMVKRRAAGRSVRSVHVWNWQIR